MRNRKGSSVLEFTMVGVPILFVLISSFEMARGIWLFHTLSYAVKEGTRYAAVHGVNCTLGGNTCSVTLGQVATRIKEHGIGLNPAEVNLTFTPSSGSAVNCTLNNCVNNGSNWPPANAANPGVDVQISATYPFKTAIVFFWPGTAPRSFGVYNMPATSRERIQF